MPRHEAFMYPTVGETVEVTIEARVSELKTNGFVLTSRVGESFINAGHLVNVVSKDDPLVLGGIYQDANGLIWRCCDPESSTPLERFGVDGRYSVSRNAKPYKLLWHPGA